MLAGDRERQRTVGIGKGLSSDLQKRESKDSEEGQHFRRASVRTTLMGMRQCTVSLSRQQCKSCVIKQGQASANFVRPRAEAHFEAIWVVSDNRDCQGVRPAEKSGNGKDPDATTRDRKSVV